MVRFVKTLITVACLAIAGIIVIPHFLGFQTTVITSGSMTGVLDRGSLMFSKPAAPSQLKTGDIITYQPPVTSGTSALVTHRIISIKQMHSQTIFATKGDANPAADDWQFTLENPVQRYETGLPWIGFLYALMAIKWIQLGLIALPALLFALITIVKVWKQAGKELARREA